MENLTLNVGALNSQIPRYAHLKTWIITFLTLLFAFQIKAQQTDTTKKVEADLYELSLEDVMNMQITTASKTEQSLAESPSAMMVITAQMISDRGYMDLEDILHDLPGFDFNKGFGLNYSTIFMRGFRSDNSDRFLLQFDGINENDIWKQTTWISRQYPVSQIKQVEVLYGPASALYGTNAFSGIINVITKKGDEVGDISLVNSAGSYGRKNIEISSGKNLSENFSYNITAKYFSFDDLHQWDEYDAIKDTNSFSKKYLNKIGPKQVYYIDGKVVTEELEQKLPGENYSIHANVRMGDVTLTGMNWTKKELEAYVYNPFKRYGKWTQWYENNQGYKVAHNKKINDKISLSSSLTYRSHRIINSKEGGQKYYDKPLTPKDSLLYNSDGTVAGVNADYPIDNVHSQTIVHTDPTTYQLKPQTPSGTTLSVGNIIYNYTLSTYDAAFEEQLSYKINDKISLIGGGLYTYTNTQEDYEIGTFTYNIASTPRHIKKTIAGYGQAMVKPISKLIITAGGRYQTQKDENAKGYEVFTPRISAVIKATDKMIFRLQYAEAFQEADDWHKFATDGTLRPAPSPKLDPEKLVSYELGTTMNPIKSVLFSASGFYTEILNKINLVNITPTEPYEGFTTGYHWGNVNDGVSKIYGYEISFNVKLMKGLSVDGNISGAYNYGPADKREKDALGNYQTVIDPVTGKAERDPNVLVGDIAPIKFNLGILYNYKNKFSIYPKINYVGTRKTINWRKNPYNELQTAAQNQSNEPIFREIDSYMIVGVNVNILDVFGLVKGLDFNIKVDNILDNQYYDPGARDADGVKYTAHVLQPGINFMAGLKYNFK